MPSICSIRYQARLILAPVALLSTAACSDSAAPPDPVPSLTIVSGGSGSDTINVQLPEPLGVVLMDGNGQPIAGVEVVFKAVAASGVATEWPPLMLSSPQGGSFRHEIRETTDASGRASALVRLDWTSGEGRVVVSAPSLDLQATASFTTLPGKPVGTAVTPGDSPVYVGGSFQIVATLVDQVGNAIPTSVDFGSSSSAIEVSRTGLVKGIAVGRALVNIRIGDRMGTASVSVVPRGTITFRTMGKFVGDPAGIAQMGVDGSDFRWIAQTGTTPNSHAPTNNNGPQWIPGTGQVVFTRLVDGKDRLFVGDSTMAARRLIDAAYPATYERDPDVSANGAWIYFVGGEADGSQELWRVATSGASPERLTSASDWREFSSPTVSPDGTRLAYVARSDNVSHLHLFVRDLSTGVETRILASEAAGSRWSPTGEWIVYSRSLPYGGYSGPLRLIRPDGTGDRELTWDAFLPGGTWSPDGKYVLGVPAGPSRMELIDITTGARLPLVYGRTGYSPSWRR